MKHIIGLSHNLACKGGRCFFFYLYSNTICMFFKESWFWCPTIQQTIKTDVREESRAQCPVMWSDSELFMFPRGWTDLCDSTFGVYDNINKSTALMAMKLCVDIHCPLRMNHSHLGHYLPLPKAPSVGHLGFYHNISTSSLKFSVIWSVAEGFWRTR